MLVLSSPSGAGKTSLAKRLLERDVEISMSVSVTTRHARPNETEGVDYHFVSKDQFQRTLEQGDFLEWAEVFGHYYGTPKQAVELHLNAGRDVLFDIDWQGTQQLHEKAGNHIVRVFILPPSAQDLGRRLRGRGQDDPGVVAERMKEAEGQLSHWAEYDYVIINDVLDNSLAELEHILAAERFKTPPAYWAVWFCPKFTV